MCSVTYFELIRFTIRSFRMSNPSGTVEKSTRKLGVVTRSCTNRSSPSKL